MRAQPDPKHLDYCESYYFEQCENPVIYEYPFTRELTFTPLHSKVPTARGKRGPVREFSPASARRFRQALGRRGESFTHFVTVTYPPELFYTFGGFRRYVRYFWQQMGRECRSRGIRYIWVREPQKNGRPHYHVLCTQGHLFKLLAFRINARFLSRKRAAAHLRRGLDCRTLYNEGGAARYASKLAAYCVKASGQLHALHDDGWRHWARNYPDAIPMIFEGTAKACDWVRSRFGAFWQFKLPYVITIPKTVAHGPPLPF